MVDTFSDKDEVKRRPAIVIDDRTIVILVVYVTTKNKEEKDWDCLVMRWF